MVLLLLLLLGSAYYAEASPQDATFQPVNGIFGRVVDSESHQAIRRADIKVISSKGELDALSDSEGRFRFPDLIPGDYPLIAHRDGYTDRAYKVEQSDFSQQKELPVELRPQAVITGRVVDGLGQALQSVRVEALASQTATGQSDVLGSAETDDLGRYRLSGLNPGTWRLRASYRDGRNSELDPTPLTIASSWFGPPGNPSEIAVKAGSLLTGMNFTLDPVRPVTVRGRLRTETGILTERATLWIIGQAGEGGHNGNSSEGEFEMADVSPGTYIISAQTLNRTMPLFGAATVHVAGADVDAVDILLSPVPAVEAEVRVEGAIPAGWEPGSLYFTRADRITATPMQIGHPGKDHKFTVLLIPGDYSLSFDESITRLGIRSVRFNNQPITNWKLHVEESPDPKKLVIVVGVKPEP